MKSLTDPCVCIALPSGFRVGRCHWSVSRILHCVVSIVLGRSMSSSSTTTVVAITFSVWTFAKSDQLRGKKITSTGMVNLCHGHVERTKDGKRRKLVTIHINTLTITGGMRRYFRYRANEITKQASVKLLPLRLQASCRLKLQRE